MNQTVIYIQSKDSFAAYRLPGEKDYHLFLPDEHAVLPFSPEYLNEDGFIVHPFIQTGETKAWFLKATKRYQNQIFSFKPESKASHEDMSKEKFFLLANQFLQASSGDYLKLVLSRTKSLENKGMDLFELFLALQQKYPNAFVYIFNHPQTGCWMGASPEMLLRAEQNMMQTVALAGTRLYQTGEETIFWSAKDRLEQDIVVQYVENALKAHHLKYTMKGPEDQRAGKLVHLKTSFVFEAPEDTYGLIHHLHPTPAVCGLPKNKSLEYIAENETHDRLYYAGFLGPVQSEQKLDLFVNLRCMHVSASQFVLYAGSGIIPDSTPEGEWEETERKFRTMQDIIEWVQSKNN